MPIYGSFERVTHLHKGAKNIEVKEFDMWNAKAKKKGTAFIEELGFDASALKEIPTIHNSCEFRTFIDSFLGKQNKKLAQFNSFYNKYRVDDVVFGEDGPIKVVSAIFAKKAINESVPEYLLKRVIKTLKQHSGMCTFYVEYANHNSLAALVEWDKKLKVFAKNKGEHVYGFLETCEFQKVNASFEEYIAFVITELAKEENSLEQVVLSYNFGQYKVRQLTKKIDYFKESADMKHCVAGYFASGLRKESIIISFFHPDKKKRATMELACMDVTGERYDNSLYYNNQCMHYCNKKVSDEIASQMFESVKEHTQLKLLTKKERNVVINEYYENLRQKEPSIAKFETEDLPF